LRNNFCVEERLLSFSALFTVCNIEYITDSARHAEISIIVQTISLFDTGMVIIAGFPLSDEDNPTVRYPKYKYPVPNMSASNKSSPPPHTNRAAITNVEQPA
jgi:hypothetical protein